MSKTTHSILALIALWIAIVWRLSANIWLDASLLAVGGIVSGVVVWWIGRSHAFAEKNPIQAMLSGAQYVEIQKFQTQVKGLPNPSKSELVASPNLPAVPSSDPYKDDRR